MFERRLRRLLSSACWLILIGLFLTYTFVSDRSAIGERIAIWPSFFWCFGLIPMALFTWDRESKKPFLILLGGIFLFVLSTTEWRSLVRFSDGPLNRRFQELKDSALDSGNGTAIRLITWNMNGGAGGNAAFLKTLEEFDPDLIFFQETPDGPQSAALSNLTGQWEGFHWLDAGDVGLLTRYPMEKLETEKVGPWTAPLIVKADLPNKNIVFCVNVRLMLPAFVLNPFRIRNWADVREQHDIRIKQFLELTSLIERTKEKEGVFPVILAGDFNTPAHMWSLTPIGETLVDTWSKGGIGWGGTMTNQFPVSRIDQCWVSSGIQSVRAQVFSGDPSDHRFLMVDLILP